MPSTIDTRDLDATSGAVYFSVGRGTEGGPASYHLAIAGITQGLSEPHWGTVSRVAQNSGYSLGAIQVDFGQRGTWPLGAINDRALRPGETTYVDAVIAQASAYAQAHDLHFSSDHAELRRDLLSHGNGQNGRSALQFIDTGTRDSINAWAGSAEGKQWIHAHIDYPQVRNATQTAMTMLDAHGSGIAEQDRFEAISIIAKTANQLPSQLPKLQKVLEEGGDYAALRERAGQIRETYRYYDGPKAGDIAVRYERSYASHSEAMDRAHAKVSSRDYSPAGESGDTDIRTALDAIGARHVPSTGSQVLREGSSGREVLKLENNLLALGFAGAAAQQHLNPDRSFDHTTRAAVEAFQRAHGLEPVDGKAGPVTLAAVDRQARALQSELAALGMTNRSGQPLASDGYLGADSRHAIGLFQQQHGLENTGIADAATRQAMQTQQQALQHGLPVLAPVQAQLQRTAADTAAEVVRPLSDWRSPQNWLYMETLVQVKFAEEARGLPSGEHSEKLAAALTVEAARSGLFRVDRVELNEDGSLARAVQTSALRDENALNRTSAAVSTHEAMRQSVQESSERALQAGDQYREQQRIEQQQQLHGPQAMMA